MNGFKIIVVMAALCILVGALAARCDWVKNVIQCTWDQPTQQWICPEDK